MDGFIIRLVTLLEHMDVHSALRLMEHSIIIEVTNFLFKNHYDDYFITMEERNNGISKMDKRGA